MLDLVVEEFEVVNSMNTCSGRCGGGCQNSGSHRCNQCTLGNQYDVRSELTASVLLRDILSIGQESPPARKLNHLTL